MEAYTSTLGLLTDSLNHLLTNLSHNALVSHLKRLPGFRAWLLTYIPIYMYIFLNFISKAVFIAEPGEPPPC